ncbi:MAG: hypothetical protein IKW83_11225 [Muribaculaceae bacterium]|nr:hypothetical protein [Muribaculaceae bacterium]
MATQSIATAGSLRQLATDLNNSANDIFSIEKKLQDELNGLLWQDEVAARYKSSYYDCMEQVNNILIAAIRDFTGHLEEEARIISQYDPS